MAKNTQPTGGSYYTKCPTLPHGTYHADDALVGHHGRIRSPGQFAVGRTTRHRPPHKCRWQLLMDMLQIQQLPLKSSGILWRVWRVFRVWRVLQVVERQNQHKIPLSVGYATEGQGILTV